MSNKPLFSNHCRKPLVNTKQRQNSLRPWQRGWSPQFLSSWNSSLISRVNSERHGFPLCSPQTIGESWERKKRQTGEAAMACRLPFLRRRLATAAILGACFAWGLRERERRDFTTALRNEKWHGFPKRGASSASYGLVKAVILICTPFLCCLIMEQRCQGLIGRITWSPVTSRYGR